MSLNVVSDAEIIQEVNNILLQNMSPSKVARFWAIWQKGEGDYLKWRDETFDGESVDSLFAQIKLFEKKKSE